MLTSTCELDILDALNVNGRLTFGWRTTITMPCWIVSEGGKDSSTEVGLDRLA